MTYKVKNIQYRIQLDTDKNIFIVFVCKKMKVKQQLVTQLKKQLHT